MFKRAFYPLIAFGFILGIAIWGSVFVVTERQQALVLQFGEHMRTIQNPGLYFKMPFIQDTIYLDKRLLSLKSDPEEVIASDQKRLVVDIFLRYKISEPLKFYQAVRTEQAANSRLRSYLVASLSRILGRVPMSTMLSPKRVEIMDQIQQEVNREAKGLGVEVVDVRITKTDLPPENSEAIYRRMNSERDREAQEIRSTGKEHARRITAEAEKQKTVIIATAQKKAQAMKGLGDKTAAALYTNLQGKDPNFYAFVRSLEAYKNVFTAEDTTYVVVPDEKKSSFFKYFNKP